MREQYGKNQYKTPILTNTYYYVSSIQTNRGVSMQNALINYYDNTPRIIPRTFTPYKTGEIAEAMR